MMLNVIVVHDVAVVVLAVVVYDALIVDASAVAVVLVVDDVVSNSRADILC